MFCSFTASTRPYFQWNVDTSGGRSHKYLLYYLPYLKFVSLTGMTSDHNHGCHLKENFYLFYFILIYIYQICTPWTKIRSYHITWYVLHTCVIFYFLLYLEIVHLLLRKEDVNICSNHLHPQLPWLSWVTNGPKWYLLFKFQTWNLTLQPAYNRCKLANQRLWCSNYIPYNNLYWS